MKKTLEIGKAELLLCLELAKEALEMQSGFKMEVGGHTFIYNWCHSPSVGWYRTTLTIDDLKITNDREEMLATLIFLITLCKNPVGPRCSFSKGRYGYTFGSWQKAYYPEGTVGFLGQLQLIPTVCLSVEEIVHDEDCEGHKQD